MFQNLVSQFKAMVLDPAIDARMRAMGEAGVAEATRLVPVDTGALKASISYFYDQKSRTVTLTAEKPYSLMVELGTARTRAQPFLRPAVAVMGHAWSSLARIGIHAGSPTIAVSAPSVPEKHHARALAHTGGRIGRARLKVGHGKYR